VRGGARGPARAALLALLPFGLHAAARAVDAAVGLLLHTSLDLPDLVPRALALLAPADLAGDVGAALGLGLAAWAGAALVAGRGRLDAPALDAASPVFLPLLLRPALTLLALGLLWLWPAYPYGFTLPVALTQDWAPAQDLAAGAALLAGLGGLARPAARAAWRPAWSPRAWEVGLAAFLLFALTAPEAARRWDGHPGNEPKYLRMAVALGHFGSLDVERAQAPMEQLGTLPVSQIARRASVGAAQWLARAAARLAGGPEAFDPAAIRARPDAHLTVRGPDGGAYHVLAPGPALLLAPALRLDRALNQALGRPGRVTVAVLLWNLMAALVVALTWSLSRAGGAPGPAAGLAAAAVALSPPLLLYARQFYPEVPAAAILAGALLALRGQRFERVLPVAGLGLALACLPWLHQKYLPLWAVLTLAAAVVAVERLAPVRLLAWLLAPQALALLGSLALNLALTGSPRPDALFRALGRSGVGLETLGQGLLGLLLDARYGLVPFAPWLLLAASGLALGEPRARWLRWALPAPMAYYVTVAAAENWTGSISNLGRFLLPVVPVLAAFAAVALDRLWRSSGGLTLALALAGWSAACARLLWLDPAAANDSGVLLARSIFADGHVYLPNLLLRSWSEASGALPAQLLTWGLVVVALILAARRASAGRSGSAWRALVALVAVPLALALLLERWPGGRQAARHPGLPLAGGGRVLLPAGCLPTDAEAACRAGVLELVVRSREPLDALLVSLQADEGPPAAPVSVPLRPFASGLVGRRGSRESLAAGRLELARPARLKVGR